MSVATATQARTASTPRAWPGVAVAAVLSASVVLLGCTPQGQQVQELTAQEEQALADTIESQAQNLLATASKLDPEAYLQLFSDDLHFLNREWVDRAEFEKGVRKLMAAYQEYPVDVTETRIEVLGRDAAVASLIFRAQPVDTAGESREVEAAITLVYERRDGEWKVVQAHESMIPSEEESG